MNVSLRRLAYIVGELANITEKLDDIIGDSELHEDCNETEASNRRASTPKKTPMKVRVLRQKSLEVKVRFLIEFFILRTPVR